MSTDKERRILAKAMEKEMKPIQHMFPTSMSGSEYKRAEIEHAEGVAVRMNPATFRVEYYEVATGKVVSSHY